MALSFIVLSIELDSPTFRVLSTGLLIILQLDYFCCWGFTIRDVYAGKLLDGRPASEKTD